MPVEEGLILIILPVGEKMICLLWQGKSFIVDAWCFVGSVFFLGIELTMQDEDLKTCILIEKNKAGIFSGETTIDYAVELIFREESIDNFLFVVKSELVFQCH